MSINYDILPEHLRDQARRYIEEGILPGMLLTAAFADSLGDAWEESGDEEELAAVARFMVTEAPPESWGSYLLRTKWIASFTRGGSRCPATGNDAKTQQA